MEHTVYFRRQPDYDQQTMDQAVESFFAASPAAARLKDGMRVTIKPNLLAKHAPEKGVTTHPALVRAVIRAVRRRGAASIMVTDSPGGVYNPAILRSIYKVSGLADVCREEGAALYTGESDIAVIMVKAGLGLAALVILVLSTVTTTSRSTLQPSSMATSAAVS